MSEPQGPLAAALTSLPRPLQALLNDRRVRYVLTGGGSAAIGYAIFSAMWLLTSTWLHYLVVAVLANFSTAVVMYPFYRRMVFKATGPYLAGFLRFYMVYGSGLLIGMVGLSLLVELVNLPVLLAQLIIIATVPLVSYQVYRLWAFSQKGARKGKEPAGRPAPHSPQTDSVS